MCAISRVRYKRVAATETTKQHNGDDPAEYVLALLWKCKWNLFIFAKMGVSKIAILSTH